MSDYAHNRTDEIISTMQKRIEREYRTAMKDVQEKLDDYLEKFKLKDQKWKQWVKEGKRTNAEYKAWRKRQIIMGRRWNALKDQLAGDFHNANEIAKNIMYGYRPEIYALNHNWSTYVIEQGLSVDTSYTLYSRMAVEKMLRENPDLLPPPGKKVSKRIAEGLDVRWNRRKIQSVMMQAILQGEAIPRMAKRLAREVGDSNFKAAIRNARTMATGAENAGRIDSYTRAKNMGIRIRDGWLATLDMRTRHEHRFLDGMTVEVGEPFKVDGYKIRYPGDPQAPAHLIYNCRCTLVPQLLGFEHDFSTVRTDPNIAGMTYEEWKMSKIEKTIPITSQYEKGEAIRNKYIREYRYL